MAASYFTATESTIDAPPILPTYSTSHSIPNEKQQAIEKKSQLLMEKFNLVPFVPSKNLDFSKHENMLKRLGLWDFAHMKFDTGVNVDLIADLVASYDPISQCSYVKGTRITVNMTYLASAMKLHLKKSVGVELDLKKDSMEFIMDFLLNWVVLHSDTWLLPIEVLNWVKVIKDKHPEKLDWAKLLWFMVEKELTQGIKLKDCYYASHLHLLIKSQCEDVLIKEEAKNWERVTNELHKEIKKRDEKIIELEHDLYVNKELVERYKEALEEMHNVVKECKKMCKLSESTRVINHSEDVSNKRLRIEPKSECKKKFIGTSKQSWGKSWRSEIQSAKLKARIHLGTYKSEEAAARAYDAASLWINGSKAKLNFPSSYTIVHLPPPDTVMSPQTIKIIAAAAANNTSYLQHAVTNNQEE